MSRIIINPYSRRFGNQVMGPKDYPHWKSVIRGLKADGHFLIQIGQTAENRENLPVDEYAFDYTLAELEKLALSVDTWISVDTFFPHLCHFVGANPGVVIWGKSDPELFGYPEHVHLLRDRKFLRPDPYGYWEIVPFDPQVFVSPDAVVKAVRAIVS
jgi:hypothetical protein